MKAIIIFIIPWAFICLSGCKLASNATLIHCDSGGMIVDHRKASDVAELQLGVPNHPLTYSDIAIKINGTLYSWDVAILQDDVRIDIPGPGVCQLVSKKFGSWPAVKKYYFHKLHAHFYVVDNKVYAIRLHNPPKDWDNSNTIILDGKDLRDLSVESAKKLFGEDVEFEVSYVLWGMG